MHDFNYKNFFMLKAFELAQEAFQNDEVPVGAVVVHRNQIIGTGFNRVIEKQSPVYHAEINAINEACFHLKNYRLNKCFIFSTLEPCHMCAKAIIDARIEKLFFGAKEPKSGAILSVDNFFEKKFLNHQAQFEGGIQEEICSNILKKFFLEKRIKKAN